MSKKKIIALTGGILAIGITGYSILHKTTPKLSDVATVQYGTINQEVSVTGHVIPVYAADLSFKTSGRIATVLTQVGAYVEAGFPLVTLDGSGLESELSKATADIAAQEARLSKAKLQLEQYYQSSIDTLEGAYTTADNAVRSKTSSVFSGYKTTAYALTYTSCSPSELPAISLRRASETELDAWQKELTTLNETSSLESIESALATSIKHLDIFRTFLERTAETLSTGCTLPDTSLNTYRTNISSARDDISATITSLTSISQDIALQKSEVLTQEASLNAYRATAANLKTQLSDIILRAPFRGRITKQDARVGEITSVGKILTSLISAGSYEIEAQVPEADIAKITTGNKGITTLDAYGEDVFFDVVVAMIDPSETLVDGVPTYKVTFRFAKSDSRIKSGMTANVDIATDHKDNVLKIPQRAVIVRGREKFVRVVTPAAQDQNATQEISITTGLRGSDGTIEVLTGLREGDRIVTLNIKE